jgi:uncharacterized membrane protein (UPF0127 family)
VSQKLAHRRSAHARTVILNEVHDLARSFARQSQVLARSFAQQSQNLARSSARLVASVALLAFALLTFGLSACAQGPRIEIVGADGARRAAVAVEIADTPASREYGLMFRKHLDEDAGMIFVFKAPQHLEFWMKNTIIPLDMIFADSSGKIVGVVRKAEPFSETIESVDGDSQYVLEVNGGFCERHGIKPGDMLHFVGFVPQSAD